MRSARNAAPTRNAVCTHAALAVIPGTGLRTRRHRVHEHAPARSAACERRAAMWLPRAMSGFASLWSGPVRSEHEDPGPVVGLCAVPVGTYTNARLSPSQELGTGWRYPDSDLRIDLAHGQRRSRTPSDATCPPLPPELPDRPGTKPVPQSEVLDAVVTSTIDEGAGLARLTWSWPWTDPRVGCARLVARGWSVCAR
jgi:hypothetical protein